MFKGKKIITFMGLLIIVLSVTSCGGGTSGGSEVSSVDVTHDREGYPITLPDEINTIISIGPSNTEVLVELGFGSQIISTDKWSEGITGITSDISVLDMMSLDAEFIINSNPDIIFITGMTRVHGDDHPLQLVSDAGIAVIYMPSSTSIADIFEDIRFMAAVLGVKDEGERIAQAMQDEIDRITQIAETITQKRTVYFEIAPAPNMWAVGGGTFQHEIIELAGAQNIFADQDSWIAVSDEMFLMYNPDVILTSTYFIDDPVGEILARPGWGAITAVQNGDVILVNSDNTNRPSHNIVKGLREIAQAIYPEYFNED